MYEFNNKLDTIEYKTCELETYQWKIYKVKHGRKMEREKIRNKCKRHTGQVWKVYHVKLKFQRARRKKYSRNSIQRDNGGNFLK